MIATPALAWVLSAAFVLSGGYALLRWAATMTGSLPPAQRTTELAHLLMSVSMLVMTWTWFGSTGLVVQVALFALFTVYFVVRAGAARRGLAHACTGGQAHALAAGAMVWMLVSMPLIMATPVTAGSGGGHAGHAEHGGGGTMDMAMPSGAPAGWAVGLTLALCVALLVASGYWAMRALRREPGAGPGAALGTAALTDVTSADAASPDAAFADGPIVPAPAVPAPAVLAPAAVPGPAVQGPAAVPATAVPAAAAGPVAVAEPATVAGHAAETSAAEPLAGVATHTPATRPGAFTPIGPRSDAGCHAVMCLGMATMLLAMVAGW